MTDEWDLSMPLLGLSDSDELTLEQAARGIAIWGSTGSGKTSGSGQAIARSYLKHGFGGLVLCAKKSEADWWLKLAEEEGRSKSIIHVHPNANMMFDFLDYEMRRMKYED